MTYTTEQETFRSELREWLDANVPRDLPPYATPEGFQAHREWERKLSEAGYAGIGWPVEFGGRGRDSVLRAIFEEEYLLAGGPVRVGQIGLNLMGPTLMVHGTAEQQARWLPRILHSQDIWSQGFSEPGAGSDLAGLTTRAEREGEDLIVNGQKIWTSFGTFADWIFVLVRTGAPRHAGITFVAIDMRSDGVDARPIVQLDGHAGFAEVFFTDVRVPVSNVIGAIDDGWNVAMTTLGFERDAPAKPAARYIRAVRELHAMAKDRGVAEDALVRDRLGALHASAEAYRLCGLRTLTRLELGESIGAEASVTKILWSELERELYETGWEILGPKAEAIDVAHERWHANYWFARAATIYAGTSEIQRNIIAERILGLPKS
ncbi:MAG: acyl-CoA dehydrogenase family protein [Actinomycetota bacterium]